MIKRFYWSENFIIKILIVLVICLPAISQTFAQEKKRIIKLEKRIAAKGYIGFNLETVKNYSNGLSDDEISQTLLELPDLGKFLFIRSYSAINIAFLWDKKTTHQGFFYYLKEICGPEKYFFQISWDAEKGLSDMYMNGIPFKLEKEIYNQSWIVQGTASEVHFPADSEINVSNVEVLSEYLSSEQIKSKIPRELYGKNFHLLKAEKINSSNSINERRGELLYSSQMNNEGSLRGWILEGPGIIDFQEDELHLSSQIPNPPDGFTGHFNYWAPVEFPESFIAEWEFKPVSEHGVCHFFFAAKGEKGVDIMDKSLAPRDGHYAQYHSGDLKNYFFIYYSNWGILRATNFATSSLHKANKYAFLEIGKIAVMPGEKKYSKLTVLKDKGHIQLWADGKLCLDYTDPGNAIYGELNKEGRIGFRQMAETIALYKNFKVWELK